MTAIAKRSGLPTPGSNLALEVEIEIMLRHFHSIGAVCWFDLPNLRDLVILDPQWVLDAVTMVTASSHLPSACPALARTSP